MAVWVLVTPQVAHFDEPFTFSSGAVLRSHDWSMKPMATEHAGDNAC